MVKNQSSGIFMIGLLVVGAMAVIGWGSPAPTKIQGGTASCTISALGTSCQFSPIITFSPAFSATPKLSVTAENSGVSSELRTSVFHVSINSLSDVWTSMPVARTELFGGVTNRVQADLTNTNGILLCVEINAASGTTGAALSPEYSTDNGVTWNQFGTPANVYDVLIDGSQQVDGANLACANGSIQRGAFTPVSVLPAIALVRVVGYGGNGVGDNPSFYSIIIEFWSAFQNTFSCAIQVKSASSWQGFAFRTFATGSSVLAKCDWIATA